MYFSNLHLCTTLQNLLSLDFNSSVQGGDRVEASSFLQTPRAPTNKLQVTIFRYKSRYILIDMVQLPYFSIITYFSSIARLDKLEYFSKKLVTY